MFSQATGELDDSECTAEQINAYREAMRQNVLDNHMRLADTIKEHSEQAQHYHATAVQELDRHLQKSFQNPTSDLPKSDVQELLASRNISALLEANDRFVSFVEMLEKTQSNIRSLCAMNEEMESLRHQAYGIKHQIHDMLGNNIFPDTADDNPGVLFAECRFSSVSPSRIRTSCSTVGSDEDWVFEGDVSEIYAKLAIIAVGVFAGTLAVSCAVTAMLCTAVRLLGGPQVRVFGMTWLVVVVAGWVICLIGII